MRISTSVDSTTAGKGCTTVFLSAFALFGIAFLVILAKAGWDSVRTYSWTKVECVIESSSFRETDENAEFGVRYRYEYSGREFIGTKYESGVKVALSPGKAAQLAQRYQQGSAAACFVNPENPSESTMIRSSLWVLLFGLLPLLFIVIGIGGIIAVWRAKPPSATAVSERFRPAKSGVLALRAFGIVFIAIGGGTLYAIFIKPMMQEAEASKWPQVPCEIVSSKVQRHRGSKSTTYSIDIRYRYSVDGREYVGTQFNFGGGSSSNRGWKDEVVATLPKGTETLCYVNPSDPMEAVLSVEPTSERWFAFIPGVFVIAGLGMFFGAGRVGRGSQTKSGKSLIPLSASHAGTDGETQLKSASTPGCTFAFIALFALFWNGIVWVLIATLTQEGWFPRIFLSVFALVGLGIAVAAAYQFLSIFNPRAIVSLNRSTVPIGGEIEMRWRFTGNVRRLRGLRISLLAREEATYRRGTSTTTDRTLFVNQVLFETTDRAQMPSGRVAVRIPRGLVHSFSAPNNRILWLISVKGDIPRWPDVSMEFPFSVTPIDPKNFAQHPSS